MALKDHILKLADGVSKCQENAKSLAQVIFRGLDDIADNLPDSPGGGSTVEVTQVLESGTKIATITVDNTPTDLFAPSPTEPTDVDVTQIVSTGTKIATITVDNVPTDLYAPAGSASHIYSTTEQVIGKWIDNKDLYEVTVSMDNPTAGSSGSCTYIEVPYSVNFIDYGELENVSVYDSNDQRWYHLPFQRIQSTESINVQAMALSTGGYALTIHWITAGNTYNITKIRYTIHYTKSS